MNDLSDERRTELQARLHEVQGRIEAACARAGRAADDVGLVVVTKFFPASDVRLLYELGVRHVGENRHQEALEKQAHLTDLADLRWHFIGGLQSNKAQAVTEYASMVESVDRAKLLAGLDRGAAARGEPLDVLLQVSLDPDGASGRSGVAPADVLDLAERVGAFEHVNLRGLMAVAPLGEDPATAFSRLAEIRERFLSQHPDADVLSAGMSGDLEAAIAHGATHVRLGSAILGPRASIQ